MLTNEGRWSESQKIEKVENMRKNLSIPNHRNLTMKIVASACMVLTVYGLAVIIIMLIRILIHPCIGAIKHRVY